MSSTPKQKRNEHFAKLCDQIASKKSIGGTQLRAINRRIEKRKRAQLSRAQRGTA